MSAPTKGHIGLAIGQRRVPVYFGRFVLEDFALQQYIENTTADAPPLLSLKATPGERILQDGKIVGVWLEVNGAPDTTNYVLRWVLV
jgi:hypothetical protein